MLTWCSRAVNLSFLFFFAASRTRSSPLGPLSRLGVWCELGSGVFSLVSGLPSTTSAGGSLAFVRLLRRYYAAVRLPAAVHVGLIAHRLLLTGPHATAADGNGVSRFSRMEFLCMLGVFDSAGPRRTRVFAHARCCLPYCLTPSAPWYRGISELNFGIPSLHDTPVQRFKCDLTRRPRMARGQDGSLFLSCMTLSFTTSCRFIPTLSRS